MTVTSDNFEALLLASARQATAIARGEAAPARTTVRDCPERSDRPGVEGGRSPSAREQIEPG